MDIGMKAATADVFGVSVPDTKEDSLDIYDDLDMEPSSSRGKSPPDGHQLKESMDLYEEIVREEQQNKESTYSELMSRFQAAQSQIKDLHKRLEQMELQNTGLTTENLRLKKNISVLLQTARQEVARKDAEIQRLNQRPDRSCCHHFNRVGGKGPTRRPSPDLSKTRQLPPTTAPPPLPHPPNNPPPAAAPPPTSPPRKGESAQSSRREISGHPPTLSGASKSSHSHSKGSSKGNPSSHHSEPHKQKSSHREGKRHTQPEPSDREHGKDGHGSERNGGKSERSSGRSSSRSSKNRNHGNDEEQHRSHRMKSPPLHDLKGITSSDKKRSHERRQDAAEVSTTDSEPCADRSCKESYSRTERRSQGHEQRSRSSDRRDQKKVCSKQPCVGSKERTGERPPRSDPRKEDGPHASKLSRESKRSLSSERSRNGAKQGTKDSHHRKERRNRDHQGSKHSCDKPNVPEKSSVEENSPNRKLCFMETLNLTRSPIKKAALSNSGSHDSADTAEENALIDGSSQPDIENMHVIDEVNSSEPEAGMEDGQQPQKTNQPQSESCEDETRVPGNDPSPGESAFSDRLVQAVPAHVQPFSTEENQKTHTSPDSSSFQAETGEGLGDSEDPQAAPNSHADESGPVRAAAGETGSDSVTNDGCQSVTEASETGSEQKCSPKITGEKNDHAAASQHQEDSAASDVPDTAVTAPPQDRPLPSSSPAPCSIQEKDSDVVSSTISLESLPQEGLSLPDAIYILTQSGEPAGDAVSTTDVMGCPAGYDSGSKISSTTQEVFLPDGNTEPAVTPKRSFSPAKSHQNFEPRSKPLLHDEDSLMRILSNLRRIPDAISPLRSPIRASKRSPRAAQSKPGHIKSLEKDFSLTAAEGATKKLDVNKENKYPGSPAKLEAQTRLPSNPSDTELEEGEIFSESDEPATDSPAPAPKRTKLERSVKNKPSPKTLWSKAAKERCAASKEAGVSSGLTSTSPKSRFKTVCPAASKSSFSSVEEVMETFRLVRGEIRKKYMKLHKSFPRKSFYGVMDNFQESFLEFVDGAGLGTICSQQAELKSKLKKLITSVFSKVSNNGIVKRIFEQQAADLKQKLWDFVDVQVDYLFRDICSTLKLFCIGADTEAEETSQASKQAPTSGSKYPVKDPEPPTDPRQPRPSSVAPYRTGLGSRGKDIRILHVDEERKAGSHTQAAPRLLLPTVVPVTPEKSNSFLIPQNGSLLDKTDFELLTEQQASSLTFNLVRDIQMGEIFNRLLEGKDLLETSSMTPDGSTWPLGTPRKDGDCSISMCTPSKFDSPAKFSSNLDSPSRLIAAWSSISPHKLSSPRSKAQLPLSPALFDESCLLEVPSENRAQRPHSVLAEDLAVSLTIPSPLKSDSHLSFLHPASMSAMSMPDSVIFAHISEDARLDGEDATEQDIHLALDTDNSSCGSSHSHASEVLATPFVFKPDQPMQALVMEKSNDHFIVKIRQASARADSSSTCRDELQQPHQEVAAAIGTPSTAPPAEKKLSKSLPPTTNTSQGCSSMDQVPGPRQTSSESKRKVPDSPGSADGSHNSVQSSDRFIISPSHHGGPVTDASAPNLLRCSSDASSTDRNQPAHTGKKVPESSSQTEKSLRATPGQRDCWRDGKRKNHQEKSGRKRPRKQQEGQDELSESRSSPNSLHAKNVVKKKGAVVMSWTRDEDRMILMELKAKGASRRTFSALSEKLKKPSGQVAHRFYQLMRLYKKQGKVDT